MIETKFSSIYSFVLLYDKENVYLVDTKYTNSVLNFPKSIEKVTLKAYLLEKDRSSYFAANNSKKTGSFSVALITQPLVGLIYRFGKHLFQGFEESDYIATKLLLLVAVLSITMLACRIYLKALDKKVSKQLGPQSKYVNIKFDRPKEGNAQKSCLTWLVNILGYVCVVFIIGTPLYLYMKINNGSESVLLITMSFIFFFLYVSTKISPVAAPAYKNYDFIVEENGKAVVEKS